MSTEPKCMKCDKTATHKITKIVKGKVYDLLLCDEHAQAFSPYMKKGGQTNLVDLLQQILKQQEQIVTDAGPVCPNCGLSFNAYRKTLLLGCSDCYQAFAPLLVNDLRKIHGVVAQDPAAEPDPAEVPRDFPDAAARPESDDAAPHAAPGADAPATLDSLRQALEKAVEGEEFEQAAKLRDSIRHILATPEAQPETRREEPTQ